MEPRSQGHLWGLLYDELRTVAHDILAREPRNGSVHPTVLVHEAFLRLQRERKLATDSREFVRGVAFAMRRILIDRARFRARKKRSAILDPLDLDTLDSARSLPPETLLDVDALLVELEQLSPRRAEVLELRFFGGLTEEEVAEVLSVSRRTVQNEFRSARAWVMARWSSLGGPDRT